jgi:hypothetical protein
MFASGPICDLIVIKNIFKAVSILQSFKKRNVFLTLGLRLGSLAPAKHYF